MKKFSTILSVLAFFAACVAVVVAVSEFISRRRDMFDYDCDCDCGDDCECGECDCFDDEVFEEDLSFESEQEAAVSEAQIQETSKETEKNSAE